MALHDGSSLVNVLPLCVFVLSFAGEDNSMALDTYGPTPAKYSQVASWADNYLDSGVSDSHDAIDGQDSSNEYDSDHSNYSEGTVHYSYSCVPSDIEVASLKQLLHIHVQGGYYGIPRYC